ncbi:hypothetical protein VTK26DRAFT_2939 [Humicola hyalothermophila]
MFQFCLTPCNAIIPGPNFPHQSAVIRVSRRVLTFPLQHMPSTKPTPQPPRSSLSFLPPPPSPTNSKSNSLHKTPSCHLAHYTGSCTTSRARGGACRRQRCRRSIACRAACQSAARGAPAPRTRRRTPRWSCWRAGRRRRRPAAAGPASPGRRSTPGRSTQARRGSGRASRRGRWEGCWCRCCRRCCRCPAQRWAGRWRGSRLCLGGWRFGCQRGRLL